jgi:hypothetical protein
MRIWIMVSRQAAAMVIIAAVPVRIGGQRRHQALDIAGRPLARHRGRGDHRGNTLHPVGIVHRPLKALKPAIGRTDDRHHFLDPEMIEQRTLGRDDVANRDVGKSRPIGLAGGGIDTGGVGRSVGRPQHVRADHEEVVGVDRLAGPDQVLPASLAGRSARVDHLRSAGVAVRDQHRVVAVRRQRAQGAKGDGDGGHHRAAFESEIVDGKSLHRLALVEAVAVTKA